MLSRARPDRGAIERFLAEQAEQPFTYPGVGATLDPPTPRGWPVGRRHAHIGQGDHDFAKARDALRRWAMFDVSWLQLCWPTTEPHVGAVVAVLTRVGPLWSLNACRVVVVVDDTGNRRRAGFAYGTLPDHMEMGEELFLVEEGGDGSVMFTVLAFSKPRHALTRTFAPANRLLQRRFRRDACRAMARVIDATQ